MSGTTAPPFGELLRTFRFRAGLSQEALAESSGVSLRAISDLERGQRQSAHLETVRLLASALELTSDERHRLFASARPNSLPPETQFARAATGNTRWTDTLPAPATPLVGRASELDTLTALLSVPSASIVTLTGPGGVGKTRLAIEVAHRLAPDYADGAAFVELATLAQPELVPEAIARVLGMTPRSGSTADRLTAFLAPRALLLVLDNLEHVLDAAPFIARLDAACPHLTLLVTSRARLRLSTERVFPVPPLSLPDSRAPLDQLRASEAVQFFAERVRRAEPEFELSETNVAAVAEICRRVDALPLAIELAAARVPILPVPVLLERLDHRLPLLSGGDRDRPPRHQSIRETIAWSYGLLDSEAKRLLRWISVFTGGISLESVDALGHALGLDRNETLETVTTLVESGLTTRSGPSGVQPRFHLLETIREFGMEQLTELGELEAARHVHAMHFLEFASRDAPRPDEPVPIAWIGRLSTEHANLLAAFDVLCAPATAEQSLQIAAAMGPYWHTRGPYSEWEPRLSRAFELASPQPTILKTHVLFWLSLILGTSPDFPKALHIANRCLEMANQVGTTSEQASALQIVAWVHECHEHWEIARELREQAIALWISVGNAYMHAICLVLNAGISYVFGELDRAQREATQAGAMFEALGSVDWSASAMWFQGLFAVDGGRFDLAAACYEQSLRTCLQGESRSRWYRPLVGLADVAAAIGLFSHAARLLGATDEMLIVGGRDLTFFDRPSYTRAESRSRAALGPASFDEHRRAGSLLSPDDWLAASSAIVEVVGTEWSDAIPAAQRNATILSTPET